MKTAQAPRYEVWVHIECPVCAERKKSVMVPFPLSALPQKGRCFNCGALLEPRKAYKTGQAIRRV